MGDEVPAELVESLTVTAREVRRDVIRAAFAEGGGHPAGSLSVADLLTALIFRELRLDPARPDGDQLVLSKGHATAALYSALSLRGFLPRRTPGAPDVAATAPGYSIEPDQRSVFDRAVAGPGQGLGTAVGIALDARLDRRPTRVYVLLGDGECQNGGTWEALLAAAHYRLENLVVILDRNEFEADGATETLLAIEPIVDKFRAFGLHTVEIDGHDFREILGAFDTARAVKDGPTAVVAHTVSGKGVSFMENRPDWYSRAPSKHEAEQALAELGALTPERPQ
jgi:transketolase